MTRIVSFLLSFALCILAAVPAARAAAADLREGVDYVRLSPPQPQSQPGIEVIEFFSYGCPHCNEFEPVVSKWRATLPKDVHFRRVPISFGRAQWTALSKLYLALESTGDLAKVDGEVFSAIHDKHLPLADEKSILDWTASRVADAKKFSDMYRSFGIQAKASRAEQTGTAFGITSIPALAVAGRYMVVAKEAKSREELLRVTDRVIEMARREGAASAK